MLFFSINGQIDSHISINDRALNYGDGLFTTAKIKQGQIQLLNLHIQRLVDGCKVFAIEHVDFSWLEDYVQQVAVNYDKAVLKILISAGLGGRGYSREGITQANIIITVHSFPDHFTQWQANGIKLGNANAKLGLNPLLAGIKHLNRLEQVLIKNELVNAENDDLLVCNINGHVVETTSANVFYRIGQQWHTPSIDLSGVDGLMRCYILNTASERGIYIKISQHQLTDLAEVNAMFICNCLSGIIPVREHNGKELDITPVLTLKGRCK